MKKKILLSLLNVIALFTMAGCTNDLKEDNINTNKLTTIAEYEYYSTIECEAFDKEIKYFSYGNNNNWIVTADNDVYVYNLYELYSNNSNCKKIDDKFDEIVLVDTEYDWSSLHGRYVGDVAYYNNNLQ